MGDITDETTDAIVNAANSGLLGGGGVDGAIHAKPPGLRFWRNAKKFANNAALSGRTSRDHFRRQPKARYVIHTVGPVWQGGK